MLRVVLVDDEALARKGLRKMLAAHSGVEIVAEADSFKSALDVISRQHPDVILLDVRMPHKNGFELLHALESPPKVIIVTGYEEYAVKAFDIAAVDYLLKPVKPERLALALQRAENACRDTLVNTSKAAPYSLADRICLRTSKRTLIKPLASLIVLQADGDFTHIFMNDGSNIMICQPLSYFEETLPAPPFLRLNRSLIININYVAHMERKSRDEAVLMLQGVTTSFSLGRSAQKRLMKGLAL